MSVYSGFSTRAQESNYNKTLYGAMYLIQASITLLCKKVSKCSHCKFDNHKFEMCLDKFLAKMKELESKKYQPPLFSYAFKDLVDYL